jgi:flagellar hook-length control protein FliK
MKASGSSTVPPGIQAAERGARRTGKRPVEGVDSAGAADLLASLAALPRTPRSMGTGKGEGSISLERRTPGGLAGPGRAAPAARPATADATLAASRAVPDKPGGPTEPEGAVPSARGLPTDATLRVLTQHPSLPRHPPEDSQREDQLIRAAWRQATTQLEGSPPEPAPGGQRGNPPAPPASPQRDSTPGAPPSGAPALPRSSPATPPAAGPREPVPAAEVHVQVQVQVQAQTQAPAAESSREQSDPRPLHAFVDEGSPPTTHDMEGGSSGSSHERALPPPDDPKIGRGGRPRPASDFEPGPAPSPEAAVVDNGGGAPPPSAVQKGQPDTASSLGQASSGAPLRAAATPALSPGLKAWGALLDQVHSRLEALRATPDEVLRLELEPRELGRLELSLRRQGGGWVLELRADQAATAAELRNQAQDLYDRVSGTGLRLEELRVLGPPGPGAADTQDRSQPAPEAEPAPDGRQGGHGRWESDEGSADDPAAEGSAAPGRKREDFASRLERELRRREGVAE